MVSRTALDPLPGWSGARGSAELERDGDGRLSLVVDLDHRAADGAAPLREVWMMRSDLSGLVSVGFLDGDTGRFVVPSGVDPTRYPVVDVSAEAADGDPAHSGDSVVRGTLPAASAPGHASHRARSLGWCGLPTPCDHVAAHGVAHIAPRAPPRPGPPRPARKVRARGTGRHPTR